MWRPTMRSRTGKGEPDLRFQNKKVSARATALALVLGVVGVLMTALPAWAATPTVTLASPTSGARGTTVTITGTDFQNPAVSSVTIGGGAATFTVTGPTSLTAVVPCTAATGSGEIRVTNASGTSADNGTLMTSTSRPPGLRRSRRSRLPAVRRGPS